MFCWKYHLHLSSQIIPKKNKFCSAKIISIPWHIIYFEAKHFSNKLSSSPRISKNSDTIGGILKNGGYTKMLQDCLALHKRDGVGQVQNLPRLFCGWIPKMVLVLFVLKGSWQLGALPGCGSGAWRTHQLRFSSGADSNRFPSFSLFLPYYYFTRTPNHTASGQCFTPALGGPGAPGVCGGSFWKTIRASAARGQPSPAAARQVTGHLPPGNTGL